MSAKQIDAELDRIRKTNFEGSQKKFDAFLKERGISQADARDIVEEPAPAAEAAATT